MQNDMCFKCKGPVEWGLHLSCPKVCEACKEPIDPKIRFGAPLFNDSMKELLKKQGHVKMWSNLF